MEDRRSKMEDGTYNIDDGAPDAIDRFSILDPPFSILDASTSFSRPSSSGMVEIQVAGMRWLIAPEYRDLLLGPQGLRLQEWLQTGQAVAVKHGPHRAVYRVDLPGLSCYLKHNRVTDLRTWVRQLVRPS